MTSLVLPLLTLSDIDLVKKVSSHAHKWKSPLRWHRLFLQLRSEGLGDAFPVLRDWYHKDIHLWQWEAAQRRKTINSRKNFYRVIAAELSRKYDTLLIAKADRAKFARIKVAKDATESEKEKAANANRIRSSTYDLELSLIQAFSGRQGTIKVLPSENKTKTCNECGEITDFNAAENLEHTCEHCGAFWDQDVNHCRNLHIHFRDNPEDAQTKGGIHSATTKNSKKVERMMAAKAKKKSSESSIGLNEAAE